MTDNAISLHTIAQKLRKLAVYFCIDFLSPHADRHAGGISFTVSLSFCPHDFGNISRAWVDVGR